MIAEGKDVEILAKGESMYPFLRHGKDSVILRRADNLQLYDIVLAKTGNEYVLHRIIKIEDNDNIILMGDGNIHDTETVTRTDICAVVTIIARNRGKGKEIDNERNMAIMWRRLLPIRKYLLRMLHLLYR